MNYAIILLCIVRGTVSTHGYYTLLKVLNDGNKGTHFILWLMLPHVQNETIDLSPGSHIHIICCLTAHSLTTLMRLLWDCLQL